MSGALRRVLGRAWPVLLPPLLFLALHARTMPYDFVWMDKRDIQREGALVRSVGELSGVFAEPFYRPDDPRVSGSVQDYYRPLQVVAVSLVHAAVGERPAAYRAISLVSGALCFGLFAGFAWLLLGRPARALFAGLVPALHPAAIEVHVWISSMSEPFVAMFAVTSLGCAALALRRAERGAPWRWVAAALLAFVLCLLARENGAVVPLLTFGLCASSAATLGFGSSERARPAYGRLAAVSLGLLGSQLLVLALYLVAWRPFVLGGFAGVARPVEGSLLAQWSTAAASWPRALGWLVLPLQSSTSDTTAIARSPAEPMALLGIALALLSAVGWLALLRKGRGVAALGLLWIWVAYLPTSNLIPILHPFAERYLSLSVFGLALLLADGVPALLARLPRARPIWAVPLAVGFLGLLAQRSWARAADWSTGLRLFERDVARDPDYREGRYELAVELAEHGRPAEARRVLAPLLRPSARRSETLGFWDETAVYELDCHLRLAEGAAAGALLHLEELSRTRPELARRPGLRLCRGRAQEMTGQLRQAIGTYRALLESLPDDPNLALALARTHARLGQKDEAARWLDAAGPAAARDRELAREVRRIRVLLEKAPRPRADRRGRSGNALHTRPENRAGTR